MEEEWERSFAGIMSKPVKGSVSEPQPLVLYCTKDEGKSRQIKMLCGQFGYKTRLLRESDADEFVGKLAGIDGKYPVKENNNRAAASEKNNEAAGSAAASEKNNGAAGSAPASEKNNEATGSAAASEKNSGTAGSDGIAERSPAGYRQPEIMVFSGISSEGLDMFLGAWRMAGIAPVPLKAILTPYNYTWTVYQLTQELVREHTAMMMERRK